MKTIANKETENIILEFKVDNEKMKLFVDAKSKKKTVTREEILKIIKEVSSFTEAIDLSVVDDIAKMCSQGSDTIERRIIKGIPPEAGKDGKQVLLVKMFTGQGTLSSDRGSFASIHLFDNVTEKREIARLYHPKEGVAGKDALGNPIPAKAGKPVKAMFDTKTIEQKSTSDGYDSLTALISGCVVENNGRIGVEESLVLKGDLDFHYGNVDFIGSVILEGDVKSGFELRAKKNIHVKGSVQQGRVLSSEGDILIGGMVVGGAGSLVVAKGNISVQGASACKLEAGGSVVASKELVGCTTRSRSIVDIKDGRIVGGETIVLCGLEVGELGNATGVSTLVRIASSNEVGESFANVVIDIKEHEEAIKLISLHLGPLATKPQLLRTYPLHLQERCKIMLEKKRRVEESLGRLYLEKQKAMQTGEMNLDPKINIYKILFSGAKFRVHDQEEGVEEKKTGPLCVLWSEKEKKFNYLTEVTPVVCKLEKPADKVAAAKKKEAEHGRK
jgi:uncharacterized protein (DUF342 family)